MAEAMASLCKAVPGLSICWVFCLPVLVVFVANRIKNKEKKFL